MKQIIFAILMVMACMLIAGCTDESVDSIYTVNHEIVKTYTGAIVEVTVDGPADDLLVIFKKGDFEQKKFIPKEEIISSGKGMVKFGIGASASDVSFEVIIKQSDSNKREGRTVYRGNIDLQGGSVEIVEVYVYSGLTTDTRARIYNSGDLPFKIDYFIVYSSKGEQKLYKTLKVGAKDYNEVIVSYGEEAGSMRVYAYNSDDKVVAKFEGKIT